MYTMSALRQQVGWGLNSGSGQHDLPFLTSDPTMLDTKVHDELDEALDVVTADFNSFQEELVRSSTGSMEVFCSSPVHHHPGDHHPALLQHPFDHRQSHDAVFMASQPAAAADCATAYTPWAAAVQAPPAPSQQCCPAGQGLSLAPCYTDYAAAGLHQALTPPGALCSPFSNAAQPPARFSNSSWSPTPTAHDLFTAAPQDATQLLAHGGRPSQSGTAPPPLHIGANECTFATHSLATPVRPQGTSLHCTPWDMHWQQQQQQQQQQPPRHQAAPFGRVPPKQGRVTKRSSPPRLASDTLERLGRLADSSSSTGADRAAGPEETQPAARRKTTAAAAKAAGRSGSGSASSSRPQRAAAASLASPPAGPAGGFAAGQSAADVIRELQEEVESLSMCREALRSRVRALLASQTTLVSRVAAVTTRWRQAVADNAALQRHNLALMEAQGHAGF